MGVDGGAKSGGQGKDKPASVPPADLPFHSFEKDVFALHFPPRARPGRDVPGVGLSGYDRDTGKNVPGEPVLRLPGDAAPRARPFRRAEDGS